MQRNSLLSFKDQSDWHRLSAEEKLHVVSTLDREKSTLRIINNFAISLISIASPTDLAWYVAREVVGRLGFVDCVIYYLEESGRMLRQQAAIGPKKNPEENKIANRLEIPLGSGITGHVALHGEPLIVGDLDKDSRYIADMEPARSEICVPITIDGKVTGVIDCEDPRLDQFNDQHLEILTTIAAMAGARLKMIQQNRTEVLNAALAREIDERISIETRLRESEARLQDFLEIGTDWYWELDADLCYTLLEAGSAATDVFEIKPALGQSRAALKPEEMCDLAWQDHLQDLAAERPFRDLLEPHRLKDGRTVWLSVSGRPVYRPDGQFDGYRGTAINVSELVRARELLDQLRRQKDRP